MDIIFCLSYLSLNQTIFLIEKKEAKNTIVITSNKSIEKFLSSIYNEDIVYFVNSSSLLLPNNLKRLIVFPLRILDAIIKKYIVWSYFKRIKKYLNLNNNEELSFICEPKIDGLSISLLYLDGVLTKGITRGDGFVGEIVTDNIKNRQCSRVHV